MAKNELNPKEFQVALIHALESIQREIGLVIKGLQFEPKGKIAVEGRIVLPMVGKKCFGPERILSKEDFAKKKSLKPGLAPLAGPVKRKGGP
jgi:hypothetical protein